VAVPLLLFVAVPLLSMGSALSRPHACAFAQAQLDAVGGHCGRLPLDASAPPECLPRVFLMASFPTSGHELAHSVMQVATGVANTSVYGEGDRFWVRESLLSSGSGHILYAKRQLCGSDSTVRLPVGGLPTLTKTHYPVCSMMQCIGALHRVDSMPSIYSDLLRSSALAGVVRLARNPGDHLLRNRFRWERHNESDTCGHDLRCFHHVARPYCRRLTQDAIFWNKFHQFWDAFGPEVPRTTLRYEEFSVPRLAPQVFGTLIDLLDRPRHGSAGGLRLNRSATAFSQAMSLVRQPSYSHGTLLRDVCGADAARSLAVQTAAVSGSLGYVFHMKEAVWKLGRSHDGGGYNGATPTAWREGGGKPSGT